MMADGNEALLQATGVRKVYRTGAEEVIALRDVDLTVADGEFVAVMGPSGSGKTTLLNCLSGLDEIDGGTVLLDGNDLHEMSDADRTLDRARSMGFVFQAFNLIPTLTAQENIVLPMTIGGRKPDAGWLETVIETLGLGDRLTHRPSELSGGQQQRVAAARALASKPEIVFADEPSGNLDSNSGRELLTFLQQAVAVFGQTIVMVTHDPIAASYSERVVFLADGNVAGELDAPSADAILDRMKYLER